MLIIKSIEDLKEVKEKYEPLIKQRLGHRNGLGLTQILVCSGTACHSSESREVRLELEQELARRGLEEQTRVVKTGCFGFCEYGPIVMVHPGEIFYCQVRPGDVRELVEKHLIGGQVLERLLYHNDSTGKRTQTIEDIHFFQAQRRIVLRNCGVINPEEIGE